MKGLMLFFMAFGLFVTLGNDETVNHETTNVAPYVEEQTASTEPAVTEPAVTEPAVTEPLTVKPEAKDSVSYENAKYDITFDKRTMESDFGDRPYLAKDGYIYFYTEQWNNGGYDTVLTIKDDTTLDDVRKVTLKKSDLEDVYSMYTYPAKNGGYLSYAAKWTSDGSEHYFIKYDSNGNRISVRNLSETFNITKNGYVYGEPASDGTNFYVCVQDYNASGYPTGGVLMYDEDFNYVKTISDSITASVCVGNDGLVYINDCYNEKLFSYNPADDTTTLLAKIPYCGNSICTGKGDEIFIGDEVLYTFNSKTGNLTELIDFSDYDYDVYTYDFLYRDGNGDISIYFEMYTDTFESVVARLKLK